MREKAITFLAVVIATFVNITVQDEIPLSITKDILDLISDEDQNGEGFFIITWHHHLINI